MLAVGHSPTNVAANFFNVGGPEAILVGLVALFTLGPKGLSDAIKQAGNIVRNIQPTIRELQDVSKGLQSTLGDELRDIQEPIRDMQSMLNNPQSDFRLPDVPA